MIERAVSGAPIDQRLVVLAAVSIMAFGAASAVFMGNPVVALTTSYGLALLLTIVLFSDDASGRAMNTFAACYAAALVFACTLSPLPNSAILGLPQTDRLNYYFVYYVGSGLAGTEDIEVGFLLLVSWARQYMSFEVFLALSAVCVFATLLFLLNAVRMDRLVGLLSLVFLSYFSFWSGALNITRQFIAAGVGVMGVAYLLKSTASDYRIRATIFVAFVAIAMTIHASAFVFLLFGILFAFRRYGNRLLAAVWAGNVSLFGLSFFGASPFSIIPGLTDRLGRYDSSQISDAGLAQFESAGVTTGNRLDWASVLLVPALAYAAFAISQRARASAHPDTDGIYVLALLYSALCVPFYMLSFLAFGDRIAFYAFLVLPPLMLGLISSLGPGTRSLALFVLAALCFSQLAFGLYGYSPKYWLTGIL